MSGLNNGSSGLFSGVSGLAIAATAGSGLTNEWAGLGGGGGVNIPTIAPSNTWNGTAGSGFSTTPYDPPRATAKPWCQLLVPEDQTFDSDLVIGVDAGALGGLTKVTFHFEGTSVDVTSEQLYSYTDVNGDPAWFYGYLIKLDVAACLALAATGSARLYVEAVPANGAMQNKVIGPFLYYPRSTANLYDAQLTLAATGPVVVGSSYQTLGDCLTYLRTNSKVRGRITVTESGSYVGFQQASNYTSTSWTTIECATGITATFTKIVSSGLFRLAFNRIRWKGEGIVWNIDQLNTYYTEAGAQNLWIDGITVTQTGGRNQLFDKGAPGQTGVTQSSNWTRNDASVTTRNYYATDCNIDNLYNGPNYFRLVRGGNVTTIAADVMQNVDCIHNVNGSDVTAEGWRNQLPALTVSYTGGAATATFEVSGSTTASSRTVTLRENGATVGSPFSINSTAGGANYDVADVAAYVNAAGAGWSATVVDDTRRALQLSRSDLTPTVSVPATDVKTAPVTFTTVFDVHADVVQYFGATTVTVLNLTAKSVGTGGNSYTLSETGANITISGATFSGGTATTAATATVTFSANPTAGETVVINGVTYTFVNTVPGANEVRIGSSTTATLQGFVGAAMNHATVSVDSASGVIGRSIRFLTSHNTGSLSSGSQGLFIDQTATYTKDIGWRNIVLSSDNSVNTQVFSPASHLVISAITLDGSPFLLRTDPSGTSIGAKYAPDAYCSINYCALESLTWQSTADADQAIDRCFFRTGSSPSGATNSVAGAGAYTWAQLVTDPAVNNYAPIAAGQLQMANGRYAGRYVPGGGENYL